MRTLNLFVAIVLAPQALAISLEVPSFSCEVRLSHPRKLSNRCRDWMH